MSDEKRAPRAMGQLSADDPSGARAASALRKSRRQAVPVGLERVLFIAAQDPAFRAELARDAEQAVAARGLSLRDSERAMLRAVPVERLLAAVGGLDTSPENVARRGFMRAVAAGAVAVAAAGCGSDGETKDAGLPDQGPIRGIQPDDASVDLPVYRDAIAGVDSSFSEDAERDTVQSDIYSAVGDAGVRPNEG